MAADPLAEKYPSWSPYIYAMNGPLFLVDPDGNSVILFQLLRQPTTRDSRSTLGTMTMTVDGKTLLTGRTLEPPWRWNVVNQTWDKSSRIPGGLYGGMLTIHHPSDDSKAPYPAFQVVGTEPRTGIDMHPGRRPKDTQGCILVDGSLLKQALDAAYYTMTMDLLHGLPTIILYDIHESKSDWYAGDPKKLEPLPASRVPETTSASEEPWWKTQAKAMIW